MDEVPSSGSAHRLPIEFVGSGSEYFRIWIVNLLLTLVTVGLYYPFAKVRRLRYFHGATEVGGQPLSFHADPFKMLRGYLLVGLMFAAYAVAGRVSPVAGLVAFVIIALLWPALWHSSLRFRLANTGWRGLRFRFTGSRGAAYAALAPAFVAAGVFVAIGVWTPTEPGQTQTGAAPAFLALALLPLLLMLLWPWMFWLLRHYQHQHYALATEQTRFEVRVPAFYGVALRVLGLTLLGSLLAAAVAMLLFLAARSAEGAVQQAGGGLGLYALLPLVLALLMLLAFQLAVRPYLVSRFQNLVWNGTRSQHFGFDSQLRFWPLVRLTAKNWLLLVLTLGLYFPFAAVATARLRLQAVTVTASADPDTLLATTAAGEEAAAGDAAGDLLGMDIGL